jgi:tellurium resistance protein TerD
MINVPMKSSGAVNKQTVLSINSKNVQGPKSSRDAQSLNHAKSNNSSRTPANMVSHSMQSNIPASTPVPNNSIGEKPIPSLLKPIQKGQKVPLEEQTNLTKIQAKFGWNIVSTSCDVDVSAFLLNSTGKVLGDSWFVFYGQESSPDGSTAFSNDNGQDREIITVDFTKLNSTVTKIVFVLTINEALEKNLNFSMLKDAYIRIMDATNTELVSFKMDEYYSNVTSMMIGEIYQHGGKWKFNAVGNGVARDLAGLCELYGVQVV